MKNRRFRTEYDFSKQAEKVRDFLREKFPFCRMYVEYPYTKLLKTYYKKNKVPKNLQDQHLLSLTKLKADFVILDYDLIIEVDGEQHFMPVQFGGMDFDQALDNYYEQLHRDGKKLLLAKEIEFNLIRLRYDETLEDLDSKIWEAVFSDTED